MDSYYEANAATLNASPEKWPKELKDRDVTLYNNVVELAENRTWRDIGKEGGVSVQGVIRTTEEVQSLLENAYGTKFISTSVTPEGERGSDRPVEIPNKKQELKALVRKELLAGKTIEEILADINKTSTGEA